MRATYLFTVLQIDNNTKKEEELINIDIVTDVDKRNLRIRVCGHQNFKRSPKRY